jgi:hypothetical protein
VARFGDNKKLTADNLMSARLDLEVLRALGVSVLLSNSQDLQAILLGELLFSEQRISPKLITHVRQLIKQNSFRVSDKQINDIYRRSMGSDIYWLLLKSEAEQAGIRVPEELARNFLGSLITQLSPNSSYAHIVGSLINRYGLPEEDILATFGKLVAVLEYARTVCSSEEITSRQLMRCVTQESETIDVEFAKLDSGIFAPTQVEPSQQEMAEHFDKYKNSFAGTITEENPYGFGYKLPDRVGLECIAVKLSDISAIVPQPSQEDAEDYYQKHIKEFTASVSSDPNDPNSPLIEQTKSYAEAAGAISAQLLKEKINLKAESILQEAKSRTEAALDNVDSQKLSAEQFKQLVGDYNSVADELSRKHKIKIYAGKTGLLSAMDIQADKHLGTLYLTGHAYNAVPLPRIVFAIDELGTSELGPFDAPKPRMYENIGPLKDLFRQTMMVVRIIKAEKAAEPESINLAYAKNTIKLDNDSNVPEQDLRGVYSVKESVAEDLRKLAAIDTTKTRAQELVNLATKHGWEKAADKFKKLYHREFKQYQNDPNFLKLQSLRNLQRTSKDTIETVVVQCEGDPAAHFLINNAQKNRRFVDQLYSLVPQDSNTVATLPLVMVFEPDMSCYCLKSISVKRLDQQQYEKIKPLLAYKEALAQSQNVAAVHFNPENILRRTKFNLVKETKETPDANTPVQSKEVL